MGWPDYENATHFISCAPCQLVVDRSLAPDAFPDISPLSMLLQTFRFSGAILGGVTLPTIYANPGHCEAGTPLRVSSS